MEAAQICISPFLECESGRLPLPRPWPALPALPVAEAPELAEKLISPKCRPTGLCSARCQVTGTAGNL